jgi:hypothetical protein
MRRLFLTAVFVALPWIYVSEPTGILPAPAVAVAADEAPSAPDAPKAPAIDVNVNRTEKHVVWFANPAVLAIGAGGLVLLVILIAMASRGGGTTIIREK